MSKGDGPVKKHKRDSLRVLGTVGEPINPEAWRWYYEVRHSGITTSTFEGLGFGTMHTSSSFCCLYAPMLYTRLRCQTVFYSTVRWYFVFCCDKVAP